MEPIVCEEMRGALRVLWTFAVLGFQNEAAYRANFWVQIFESLLNVGSALAAVALIFARTEQLAGWRPAAGTCVPPSPSG